MPNNQLKIPVEVIHPTLYNEALKSYEKQVKNKDLLRNTN